MKYETTHLIIMFALIVSSISVSLFAYSVTIGADQTSQTDNLLMEANQRYAAPMTQPGENFKEPTSPPPYDNSIPRDVSDTSDWGIIGAIVRFFSGLFDWII